jgi:predicted dehydrogenase
VNPEDVISVRSISSSYLPDWRPGQDYRNTYSAHKDMGGGVSIDLIHEWDYLTYLFGWPQKVLSLIGKKSKLEIDSDDYALYIAEYKDKIVELHLDYFGRKTIRQVQLFTKEDTIIGDIVNNQIESTKNGEIIDFHEERDDFQKRELGCFLDMIEGIQELEDGYNHGIEVLELTQGKN